MAESPSPAVRPIHPDPKLDAYLGNMVANRRCEVNTTSEDYVVLVCGCPNEHTKIVRKHPLVANEYAQRKIAEIESAFTCC